MTIRKGLMTSLANVQKAKLGYTEIKNLIFDTPISDKRKFEESICVVSKRICRF